MQLDYENFSRNADSIRSEIDAVCKRVGRSPDDVRLLAVTKNHPVEAVEYAARYGLTAVGENRVQEGVAKRSASTVAVAWELIGHLQSNKAKLAAQHFDRVQSVDSEKLLRLLDRAASELGKRLPILLQINSGNDPAKFGAEPVDAPRLLETAMTCSSLQVDGLMAIAPLSEDSDVARRTFVALRTLRDALATRSGLPLRELSMGMSGDLAIAIEEGSTQIRIGTALFGSRVA